MAPHKDLIDWINIHAFDPQPIPGLSDRLDKLGGWVTWLVYGACLLAFGVGGGYLAWDKISDHGGNKGPKIALGAIVGSMVVASATAVIGGAAS